ncbi:MAG: hypothetical protein KDJ38_06215 [Gammaproteobacteria bacterium]|nr:hypothetical protein [Gammaproteobacteria bacterium]
MEFFAELTGQNTETELLQELLTIKRLPEFCPLIDTVLSIQSPEKGEIYCLWGQFLVSRQMIRNGVRFALLNCPHALAWTITVHDDSRTIVIHCTINGKHEAQEFVESIEQFVEAWAEGLQRGLIKRR